MSVKEYLEANLLDGDQIQPGQMIASTEILEVVTDLVTAEIIAELERLQKIHPDGRWKVIDSRIKELKAKETQL